MIRGENKIKLFYRPAIEEDIPLDEQVRTFFGTSKEKGAKIF
jgi:hypothetical protein